MKPVNDEHRYPELSEQGQQDAERLVEWFKDVMKKQAESVLDELYTDIIPHLESDSWTNVRNAILTDLCNYQSEGPYKYDYKKIRQAIYRENKDQINMDLNQDLLNENETLKAALDRRYL